MLQKTKGNNRFQNGNDATQHHISKHRGMLTLDAKKENGTCYHILEHRAMLSVGVSREETQQNITFFKMRECCQQVFKKGKARQDAPTISAPQDRFVEYVGSLLDVLLSPRGGEGAFLNIGNVGGRCLKQ